MSAGSFPTSGWVQEDWRSPTTGGRVAVWYDVDSARVCVAIPSQVFSCNDIYLLAQHLYQVSDKLEAQMLIREARVGGVAASPEP